jgi:hypothetical protein
MPRRAVALSLAALGVAVWPVVHGAVRDLTPQDAFVRHVRYLASDDLKGRGNGSRELEKAADYIAAEFKAAGLKPGGPGGSWFQPFDIVTGLTVGSGNRLTLREGEQAITLDLGTGYYPMSATAGDGGTPARALKQIPIVFAGYGISARALKYDDYGAVDVHGKAVLVFSHEPQENLAESVFNGTRPSNYSMLLEKAMAAKNHGAVVLVIVGDPTHEEDPATMGGFLKDPQAENFGVPVLRVDRARAEPLLAAWGLDALAKQIDKDLQPRSRALPGATLDYTEKLSRTRRTVRNVIGVLPGSDPARAKEAVVVGAHYDHLGLGGAHSLSPEMAGQIHNGADDNASGTAAVIEIGRRAVAAKERFPRTAVFMAFAGEELGLLGSTHWVNHPTVPLDGVTAMVNLDMVGRAKKSVLVSGLDSSPSVGADMDAAAEAGRGVEVRRFQEGAGVGASDDTSFILKKIPAFGFFSGFHSDYHRPTDDWEKIDAEGGVRVTNIAFELAARLAARVTRPEYIPQQPASHGTSSGETSQGGGYGAYFGSVPDFGQQDKGVKFAEVRENGPAGKAGLKSGDVLVEFGGKTISTLADFTFALREHSPGETVQVKVLRAGQPLTVSVLLTARP